MNYFIADILRGEGINLFRQLPAQKAIHLKPKPAEVRSYIVMLLPYHNPDTERNIARFAAFPDYHTSVKALLEKVCKKLKRKFPKEEFFFWVDNSPIAEVQAAVECGLGVLGKNNLVISRRYGSYCFIAEIGTTMELSESVSEAETKTCLNCGYCYKACPTGALSADGFCKEKCLSYITQKKGELTQQEAKAIKDSGCVWGCDKCQEACPMNFDVVSTSFDCFKDISPTVSEDMINDSEFFDKSAFAWRKKETIMRNIKLMKE